MSEHPSFRAQGCPDGEPIPGQTYRAGGWAYINPPGRFAPEMWHLLLGMIGQEQVDYVVLVACRGIHPSDGLPFIRGQLLVSPKGMASLAAASGRKH